MESLDFRNRHYVGKLFVRDLSACLPNHSHTVIEGYAMRTSLFTLILATFFATSYAVPSICVPATSDNTGHCPYGDCLTILLKYTDTTPDKSNQTLDLKQYINITTGGLTGYVTSAIIRDFDASITDGVALLCNLDSAELIRKTNPKEMEVAISIAGADVSPDCRLKLEEQSKIAGSHQYTIDITARDNVLSCHIR